MAHWVELLDTLQVTTLAIAASATYDSNLTIAGNLSIAAGQTLTVNGKLQVSGNITNAGTLVCLSLECGGALDNTGATALTVNGDCEIKLNLTNTTGAVSIIGKCHIGGDLSNNTGLIRIRGVCHLEVLNTPGISSVFFHDKCRIERLTNGQTGVSFYDDLVVSNFLTLSSAGSVTVAGKCYVAAAITLSGSGDLTVTGNLRCDSVAISNAGAVLTVEGNCEVLNTGTSVNMTAAGQVIVKKDLYCAGDYVGSTATLSVRGNAKISGSFSASAASEFQGHLEVKSNVTMGTASGVLTVWHDCQIAGNLSLSSGGATLYGHLEIGGNLSAAAGSLVVDGELLIVGAYTSTTGNATVKGNTFIGSSITLSDTGDLTVTGNLRCDSVAISNAGAVLTINGNCEVLNIGATAINMTAAAQIIVKKDLYVAGTVVNFTAALTVSGNAFIGVDLTSTTGAIIIGGNCQVKGVTTISGAAGSLHVYGDAELTGAVGATNGTATITIDGISRIYGAITATGTVTYKGVYPQAAVNITAIAASETDFVNLALTAGFRWNIRDLVMKAADPGVNTIAVRLYQLVNAALVNTHTFTIATAGALVRGTSGGFALYFSLDDMFTKQELADDNMKITVQASGGGPYAVTGAYKYSSGSMP